VVDVVEAESPVEQTGLVLSTDPPAGTEVAERSTVVLTVGTGPSEVRIGALAGLTREEAEAQLVQDGLVLGQVSEEDTTNANQVGTVLRSDPAAGVTVPAGTPVALVIGREVTTVAVPDVAGQSLDQARQTLQSAGFTDVRDEEVDGGGEEGDVLGTNPAAGQRVQPGTAVTIQVSRGNQVIVPDLVGLDRGSALDTLREAGFDAGDVREQERTVVDGN
jgi:eukaryotic-like serine/threonine-protein kinase